MHAILTRTRKGKNATSNFQFHILPRTIKLAANCNLSNLDLHRHTLATVPPVFPKFIHTPALSHADRTVASGRDRKARGSSASKETLELVDMVVTSGTIDGTSCRRLPTLRRSQARSSPWRFLGNNYVAYNNEPFFWNRRYICVRMMHARTHTHTQGFSEAYVQQVRATKMDRLVNLLVERISRFRIFLSFFISFWYPEAH